MSQFKNIEKLGLKVWDQNESKGWVEADKLENLLQSAQVVYGSPDTPSDQLAWSNTQLDCDTHKAILLNVEPIKKKTKAEAALEFIKKCKDGDIYEMHANEVMKEAKRILEMKDEV